MQKEFYSKILYYWLRTGAICELDDQLENFKNNKAIHKGWMSLLLQGLGLSQAGLAEKIECDRSAVTHMLAREKDGRITIELLRKVAHATDCHFVYGFVPKEHNSFAEMLVHKTLPFVQHPKTRAPRSKVLPERDHAARIKAYLSKPTGYGKIWQLKKALKRKGYSWIWLDFR